MQTPTSSPFVETCHQPRIRLLEFQIVRALPRDDRTAPAESETFGGRQPIGLRSVGARSETIEDHAIRIRLEILRRAEARIAARATVASGVATRAKAGARTGAEETRAGARPEIVLPVAEPCAGLLFGIECI